MNITNLYFSIVLTVVSAFFIVLAVIYKSPDFAAIATVFTILTLFVWGKFIEDASP